MAYKADIQLAVKGLRELRSLNIHLDRNGKAVDRSIEKIMKYNSVTRSHFVPTLNNLSSALAKAQANFDKANISTVQGIKAAENLAKAEKLVNAELIARNALMGTVRGTVFGPQQNNKRLPYSSLSPSFCFFKFFFVLFINYLKICTPAYKFFHRHTSYFYKTFP